MKTNPTFKLGALTAAILSSIVACGGGDGSSEPQEPTPDEPQALFGFYNHEALIPAMCYTRTEGRYNPCHTCHQDTKTGYQHSNFMDDGYLQGDYNFSDFAMTNRWTNLFVDRSAHVAAISDDAIVAYVDQDNYSGLASRLSASGFKGWIPDLADLEDASLAFDGEGFAKDGTDWVAFNYKPLPSTFWPTNGSTDDVMFRLPAEFRRTGSGDPSRDVYRANLAIVEAAIKNLSTISVTALDENIVGADLNGDGALGTVTEIVRPAQYVGGAAGVAVHTFLYPKGTEFLHSVRYVGVTPAGDIYVPKRMKELRYMVKDVFDTKEVLGGIYDAEHQEKLDGNPPYYGTLGDKGIQNAFGWRLQAFIEDAQGELRLQTHEEHLFCVGCHSTIGGTIDQSFSFPRKVTGAAGWGYVNLKGMQDAPTLGGPEGEIVRYLRRVGGGDEFRENTEMMAKWFTNGEVDESKLAAAADVYDLITPSRERALTMNKAYKVIVGEQSFVKGRDATVTPVTNVYDKIPADIVPLSAENRFDGEIRLDW